MRALAGKLRFGVSICAAIAASSVAVACSDDPTSSAPPAGTGVGGTDSGTPAVCPEQPPKLGAACPSEGLSCSFGPENPCDVAPTTCAGGIWVQQSPPYCGVCPGSLPAGGSLCGPAGLKCIYPGQPMEHLTCDAYKDQASCSPDGAWTLGTFTEDMCDPCPEALPIHGASCFVGEPKCSYTVDTPCGPHEADAVCDLDAGSWVVALPPCLCAGITDASVCAIASGCKWIDPGPCAPTGFVASCHPVECTDALCDPATLCDAACDPSVPGCDCAASPLACLP